MDDASTRTRSTSRRMASAKPATTSRRSSPRSPGKGDEAEISPARWAGVALVIAAIVAAVLLAVVSPSEPAGVSGSAIDVEEASPTPVPAVIDTRLPTVQPSIVKPTAGKTAEFEIPVTVDLPSDELPKKLLRLVILRGAEEIGELPTPKTGIKQTVHVRLTPGLNVLSAALVGPGGRGPAAEPVELTLDPDAPKLAITSPKNKLRTFDDVVEVTGTSEVGAMVHVKNEANDWDDEVVVGPSGEFAVTVRLKRGPNLIVATSTDSVKLDHSDEIRVTRRDGRPHIAIKAPKRVKKSDLSKKVRIVVTVTFDNGKPMEGATVDYTLGGPGRTSLDESDTTNANGKSNWPVTIERSSSPADEIVLAVTVTSPSGDVRSRDYPIALS